MKTAIKWDSLTKEQQNGFTMSGNVELVHWYFSNLDNTTNEKLFLKETVDFYLKEIQNKSEGESYGITDNWLYTAIEKYPIRGMKVAIMGSIKPWYESVCLHYGGEPFTFDYNTINLLDERLKMFHVNDIKKYDPFDSAFSISSFEHDGLGRYGDPLNSDGDLKAMKEMKTNIKKGGLLYLAVPIGKDKIVWNAHRVYGTQRLPWLLDGWEILGTVGFENELLDTDFGNSGIYQPIFILKNI